MANQGFRRSFRTPQGYSQAPNGRVGLFNQVYQAYVKNNDDAFLMGRLRVYIPEFSNNPDDENQWFTVRYCSPFAGATPVKNNVKEGKELPDTQQSYGWWSVPPDVENEVVVMFINGDPNRGIWIGGMYQQFMNHMVPGVPTDASFKAGTEGQNPPVAEYNRWDPGVTNSDNHTRARFEPLHAGLTNEGLYTDPQRGPSDAGARRAGVSKVYGFKSPSGSHLVFDDADDNKYIRIRTAGGTQVLINDTAGYVYVNSGNGNSWLEVSDEGVDVYSAKAVSMRSQGDMNFHADGAMNFYAKGAWNVHAGSSHVQTGTLDITATGNSNIKSQEIHMRSNGTLAVTSGGNLFTKSTGRTILESSGVLGITASGNVQINGSTIVSNAAPALRASEAAVAGALTTDDSVDRDLNLATGYAEISTKTIVSRLPTHEPWDGHPQVGSGPIHRALDTSVSTRTVYDGDRPTDKVSSDDSDQSTTMVPVDNTEFVSPITGTVGCPWGPRTVQGKPGFHRGIDIPTPIGTPVVASRAGKVVKAGAATGYGQAVYIEHDNGYRTEYGHISAWTCSVGQKVQAGQQIARSGNAGHSTGPHLHFTIKKNGEAIDPATKLKNAKRGGRLTAGRN